jgi:hypothetical protein
MAPPVYNGTYSGRSGDYVNYPSPYWNLAQWAIPAALTPTYGPSSGWQTANAYARLQYHATEASGTNVYELAQNGNTTALPCGTETDLFLGTGDPSTYSGSPDGFAESAALSALTAATMSVGMKVVYEQYNARCPTNYVGYISALILSNSTAHQTLFYQIHLRDSRGVYPNMWWCPGYPSNGSYCVDDDVRVLGGATVPANNTRVNNTVNVLSRLKQIVATGYSGLDTNPANWRIQNAYFGQVLQGGMIPTSRWYNYSFTVQ